MVNKLHCPACQAEIQPGDQVHRKVSGIYSDSVRRHDSGTTRTDLALKLAPPSKPIFQGPAFYAYIKALEKVMPFWENCYYCAIHDHVWEPTLTLNAPSAFFQAQMKELTKAIQNGKYVVPESVFAGKLHQELPDPLAGIKATNEFFVMYVFLPLFLISVVVVLLALISSIL